MRVPTRTTRALAVAMAGAFALAACGGNGDTGNGGTGTTGGNGGTGAAPAGDPDGTFSTYVGEPENPLVPGNTAETSGGQIIDALWTGLVQYGDDNELEYTGVAESIESDDNTVWTITLNSGWTFHDGTPVTAESFVDSWNYTALSTNAQSNSSFFDNIVGYDDLQGEVDEDGNVTSEPTATELSGVEIVDESTIQVTLDEPFSFFPFTLGYSAFYPLPEVFFEDPAAFGDNPVGNGPFAATGPYQPGAGGGLTTERFDDYAGEAPASGGVEFRIYTSVDTAYNDVQAGNLDLVYQIPPDAIESAQDVFGDRYGESPNTSFTYLGFPTYDERFSDPRVRQAFSMGVDRQSIIDAIFQGTRVEARSVIAPGIQGHREDACQYCDLDADAANALLDEAGFDRTQPVDLWFNAGAGHDAWVQAVGNQLQENLGIEYALRGDLEFAQYLPLADDQGFTGPFRLGWVATVPTPQYVLEPLYSTSALPPTGSNTSFYSNPEFDDLVAQGNQADTIDGAVEIYQQAEDVLLEDMPIMPMFYGLSQFVWSERVSNVGVASNTYVRVEDVTVNS